MKYDIIVPTYNLSHKTKLCFMRIAKYTKDFRLIWIDNNSDGCHINEVQNFIDDHGMEHKSILLDDNLGFIKATNIGLGISTAPWRVFLNNDAYVTDGWLDHMTYCADKNGYDIIGPLTSPNAASYQGVVNMKKKVRENIPNWDSYELDEYAKKIHDIMGNDHLTIKNGMIAFFCTAIRSKVIQRIGYLSEEFGIGFGDDDDYCERAHRNGFNLGIDLGTFVHHDHRSTFRSIYPETSIHTMQQRALEKYRERKQNLK